MKSLWWNILRIEVPFVLGSTWFGMFVYHDILRMFELSVNETYDIGFPLFCVFTAAFILSWVINHIIFFRLNPKSTQTDYNR